MDQNLVSKHAPVTPSLRFIFRLTSTLAAPIIIGDSGQGTRKVVPLTGGALKSSVGGLTGEDAFDEAQCIDGGADFLTVDPNLFSRLDARYVFRLKSGHHLYFQSSGNRYVPSGNPEDTAMLNSGEDIEPSKYYFRLKIQLESDDPQPAIREACQKLVVASAVRGQTSIVYDAYVVQ
ncbi:hypothetical protein CBS101457_000005 [Exobasidium rhododendri]|nr:hypothetical protein CBS101457_000005 [Exobasidium rhododendri]